MIYIDFLTTARHFEQCVDIQRHAWMMEDIDIVPTNILRVYGDNEHPAGFLLGAFHNSDVVGFILSFPTQIPQICILHMLAVDPQMQNQKIGEQLMDALLHHMRLHGIKQLTWTFDPLESRNAYFYIHKYGGICTEYVENYYQFRSPTLLESFPANRFKTKLFLDPRENTYVLDKNDRLEIMIPSQFSAINRDNPRLASKIYHQTRALFQKINDDNYIVVDFLSHPNDDSYTYVLFKQISSL